MYYDEIADGYEELYGNEQLIKLNYIWEKLKNLEIDLEKNSKLLDVGCGTGISSDFFGKRGFEVIGVDPSKKLISKNDGKYSQLLQGVAEKLPFNDASFDIVISITAIQNFQDIKKGLLEIKRVGKGLYLLTVLKRGENATIADDLIHDLFLVNLVEEDDKDRYYFILPAFP
jgi:ubiquinone/menaquinone biosynthesis C-methylase UbiE